MFISEMSGSGVADAAAGRFRELVRGAAERGVQADWTEDLAALESQPYAVTVPGKGSATTLDIASWNIEWFGDTGNGPSNETLQLQNARGEAPSFPGLAAVRVEAGGGASHGS